MNGTADVVQRIFEMKAEGEPLTAIKTALAAPLPRRAAQRGAIAP